jgi:cyclohexanecarboxyl-CoA dehydrogenase
LKETNMDFSFNDVQQSMAATVRKFAVKELLPKYAYWDRNAEFPREQIQKMAELGLLGLRVSAEYGGLGIDCVTAGLVMEEICRGDFNCGYPLLIAYILGDILEKFASESVKQTWMTSLIKGEKIVCFSLTEPHCGSDAAAIRTRAVRKGGSYVLNGEKSAITMLMAGDAALVFAKTDPAAGAKGVSAFLVPFDLSGVVKQSYADMGAKGLVRGSLFLDDVEVPAENLVGREGGGFFQVMQAFDYTRALIGLQCVGAAEITLEETMNYVKERTAFGKPIAQFEGVSFPLAEWVTKVEMVRWLCFRTLWLRDQGLPHTKEAAMCKWQGPDIAAEAIQECLILHGHYGYTQEFPIEQRLRDVIGIRIGDGTPQVQKIVIARELLGREFIRF